MKALKVIITLVFVAVIGCASGNNKHLPSHAFSNPIDAVSIPHPVEIEKIGIKEITTFQIAMDPALLTEVIESRGVWPIIGECEGNKILRSYAYLRDVSFWGDFILQAEFYHPKAELEKCRFLYFNRDAGYAYALSGNQLPERGEKDQLGYDPEKFESDEKYRSNLFGKYGLTLVQLDDLWRMYFSSKNGRLPENFTVIFEIKVGSEKWIKHRDFIDSIMISNPKMPDGKIRTTYVSLEKFKTFSVQRPGFNMGQRMLKNGINVPIGLSSFAVADMGIATSVGLLGNAVNASIDDSWSGYYARAEALRYDLAPMFRYVVSIFQNLLRERDLLIDDLIDQNDKLQRRIIQ